MRSSTSQHDVSRIKLRTAILNLDDVIGVDALSAMVRTFAARIFASLTAFAFDLTDKRAPFA